ncbi:hypothetical protein D3OALGB2SA_901 [Olavius algarvensis associated proteobacterium Delta 3]|nr:hypothetical protein D3OALGB2SA_901 [Olavius algarvensis associated proteobacterium Delta 3]
MDSKLIFLFKKILGQLLMPVPVCLGFLVIGLILLFFSKRHTIGKAFVAIGTCMLVLFSFFFVPDQMAYNLEYRNLAVLDIKSIPKPKFIVVLGSGHDSDPRLPANSQLNSSGVVRLMEALRLHRLLPDARIIFSGWGGSDPVPHARVMAEVATEFGIDSDSIILVTTPRDTKDEARIISGTVKKEPFLLVTSAAHMPRSLALLRKRGANPIPAPTDYRFRQPQGIGISKLFPSSENIVTARIVFHEYLGMAWAYLRDQI